MIQGTVVGVLASTAQMNVSPSGIVSTVLPVLVDCGDGAWEFISLVVRGDDLIDLPLQAWLRASGEVRLGRWQDHRGPKAQLAMRAKCIEVLALPGRGRQRNDDPIFDDPLPITCRASRQEMN